MLSMRSSSTCAKMRPAACAASGSSRKALELAQRTPLPRSAIRSRARPSRPSSSGSWRCAGRRARPAAALRRARSPGGSSGCSVAGKRMQQHATPCVLPMSSTGWLVEICARADARARPLRGILRGTDRGKSCQSSGTYGAGPAARRSDGASSTSSWRSGAESASPVALLIASLQVHSRRNARRCASSSAERSPPARAM